MKGQAMRSIKEGYSGRMILHRYFCRTNFLLLIALISTGILLFLSPVRAENLPDNFHRVTPELYRSSQPSAGQMHRLEEYGIRTVLNLRQWHSDRDEAQGTSLILYHVPVNTAAFRETEIEAALRILHRAVKPALVHCWHGSDRTGLIIALYRLVFDRVTKADALAELRNPAHGHHEQFYPDIARYIETIDVDALRQRVLKPSPPFR
jgi:tyrosine-protein phosphatase SIW14